MWVASALASEAFHASWALVPLPLLLLEGLPKGLREKVELLEPLLELPLELLFPQALLQVRELLPEGLKVELLVPEALPQRLGQASP